MTGDFPVREATDRCQLCGGSILTGSLLECDLCGKNYHLHCHNPPLFNHVDGQDFICSICTSQGYNEQKQRKKRRIEEDDEEEDTDQSPPEKEYDSEEDST